jgi:DNA repair protein RadC
MNDREIPKPRRTKAGITYSNLGQFRVHVVNDDPPPPLALDAPDSVVNAWRTLVATNPWFDPDKEHMVVFVLNTRLGLKGWNVVSVGTVNETTCHPREVLRPVLVAAGHGFVVVHNHPSGDPNPSQADREVTRRLRDAAALMQVRLIDHIIVGSNGRHYSFREAGGI